MDNRLMYTPNYNKQECPFGKLKLLVDMFGY